MEVKHDVIEDEHVLSLQGATLPLTMTAPPKLEAEARTSSYEAAISRCSPPMDASPSSHSQAGRLLLDERLASAVWRYAELYDKSMDSFKDKSSKDRAWERVSAELGMESGKEAERSFAKLRKCYTTARNNLKKSYKMGQLPKGEYLSKLEDIRAQNKHLTWLDPFIKERVRKPIPALLSSVANQPILGEVDSQLTKAVIERAATKFPERVKSCGESFEKPLETQHLAGPMRSALASSNLVSLTSVAASARSNLSREPENYLQQLHFASPYHLEKADGYHLATNMRPSSGMHVPDGSAVIYKSCPSSSTMPIHATVSSVKYSSDAIAHSPGLQRQDFCVRGSELERGLMLASAYSLPTFAQLDHRSAVRSSAFPLRDDEALFAELVASQLRQMTVEQKIQAKFEINQIMYRILLSNFAAARSRLESARSLGEPPPMKLARLVTGDQDYENAQALIANAQKAFENEDSCESQLAQRKADEKLR